MLKKEISRKSVQ